MALKDKWVDKVDGVDIASAEDINQVASAVIELENQVESGGGKGEDGFSPIVSVEKIEGGNRVVIIDTNGKKTFDVMDGTNGQDGQDGAYGTSVTVLSVNESTADGGSNVVTFSDGKTLTVKNGSKGSKGDKGDTGATGAKGKDGADGKDYVLTEADKDEIAETVEDNAKGDIVQSIIAELQGLPVFGVVDENKVITVTSQLSGGTYTLKYENADGTLVDVGTITIEGKVVIVNLLESALTPNDITTVFDGVGYKNGYYASAAEPFYNTDAAFFCSGLMPIPASRTFYIKGCTMDTSLSHTRFGLMKEDGGLINTAVLGNWGTAITVEELGTQYYSVSIDTSNTTYGVPYYFYFSASGTGDNVIVSATPIE